MFKGLSESKYLYIQIVCGFIITVSYGGLAVQSREIRYHGSWMRCGLGSLVRISELNSAIAFSRPTMSVPRVLILRIRERELKECGKGGLITGFGTVNRKVLG